MCGARLFAPALNRDSRLKMFETGASCARGRAFGMLCVRMFSAFFAFLPYAARPIDGQYATSDYMLQRNMIKYRDVGCPKIVIVLKRGAARAGA